MLFFNDFRCSELILRKTGGLFFFQIFLYIIFLFLTYISVSKNEILSFKILHSNIYRWFVFKSFTKFSTSVLLPVYMKNISSINLKYKSENVLMNEYMKFVSKVSIKMFAYVGCAYGTAFYL